MSCCVCLSFSMCLFLSVSLGLSVLFYFVSVFFCLFISASLYLCGHFSPRSLSLTASCCCLSLSPSLSLSACVCGFVFLCSLALYVSLSPSLELSLLSQAKFVSRGSSLSPSWCVGISDCLCQYFLSPRPSPTSSLPLSVLYLCLDLSSYFLLCDARYVSASLSLLFDHLVSLSLSHSVIFSIPVSVSLWVHFSIYVLPAPGLMYVTFPVFSTWLFPWASLLNPVDVSLSVSQRTQ